MVCNPCPVFGFAENDPYFCEGKLSKHPELENLFIRLFNIVENPVDFQGEQLILSGLLHAFGGGNILV